MHHDRSMLFYPSRSALILSLSVWGAGFLGTVLGQEERPFKPRRVIDKRFPAIVDPDFISADKAEIRDNELVLGVYVDGKARAYPINMLTNPTREIVNDKLGKEAIAATW